MEHERPDDYSGMKKNKEKDEGRRGQRERGLTRYERKQSQPPIHSYEPRTSCHQPSRALYHPFDHLIME